MVLASRMQRWLKAESVCHTDDVFQLHVRAYYPVPEMTLTDSLILLHRIIVHLAIFLSFDIH